ncbi:MAG: putative manganese-dependent inorganic diphosphatase [Firmicutes bacterium]|nr:putative manganese-dependent inorganic diphosphatase [Bacillota bacterium]
MKDKTYIFGHKNPDTDSVCSAISLSYLKNALGFNTESRILSSINEETKYVLKKFKINIPEILNDVKLQVSDINYHKDFKISMKESVYNAFFKMQNENMSTIPIVDEKEHFVGAFAMKDIAKKEILGDNKTLKSNYIHILEVIEGQEVLKFNDEILGNITNVDLRSTTFYNHSQFNNDTILIVGDRHSIIEDAVNKKVKLIVITGNNKIKDEHIEIARQNKVNVIYTNKDSYETLLKIGFANYIENYRYTKDLVCVNESLDISDLNDIINKTKHSYYPVINNDNTCLGLIKLSDLRDTRPKKVILVDHNETTQSVDGLDEADIIEIVDHHKLGNIGTNQPINFRNMTVGSTCTIVYQLFKENKVKIPEHIAALLLSGIISDTLLLKSPTATKEDEKVLHDLVKLTNINADKLAIEMFKSNDVVKSKSIKEVVYMDFKTFNIDKKVVAISQINTLNSKAILKQKTSYIKYLNKESNKQNYDIMIFIITDIFKNGSYILFNESAKNTLRLAFTETLEQGDFLANIVSRKKQILPAIMNFLK